MAELRVTPDQPLHTIACDQCPKLRQVSHDGELVATNARRHALAFPGHIVRLLTSTAVNLVVHPTQ